MCEDADLRSNACRRPATHDNIRGSSAAAPYRAETMLARLTAVRVGCVVLSRSWRRMIAIACACVLGAAPASAAELRITLTELAGLVQAVMSGATLHLDNKPAGLLSLSSGSYIAIAGKQTAIPLAAKSFNVLGSSYAYYVDDLNSESIEVGAVDGGIRLKLTFQEKAAELIGGCISGDCALANALPKIVWRNGTVSIDVAPVRFASSLALQVRDISIGGALSARCAGAGGVISDSACRLALPWANRTIAKLKPDLAAKMKDKVNDPATQEAVANSLKKYLTVGQAGEISIIDVASNAQSVTIRFVLPGAAAGG